MKTIKFLQAYVVALKYRINWVYLKCTKFPKIWYAKELKRFIVFCPYCREYICQDGTCSNPWCPEKLDNA